MKCVDCGCKILSPRAKRCRSCASIERHVRGCGGKGPTVSENDEDRFMAKVSPEPMSGCWLWTGCLYPSGYARRRVRGVTYVASREAWRLFRGAIPDGLCVCHRCDNRSCVNPDHLFLGTPLDNARDMVAKGRQARGAALVARMRPARGMAAGKAKLTDTQVVEILAEYARGGVTHRALAARYGVGHAAIGCIVRGTKWAHIVRVAP